MNFLWQSVLGGDCSQSVPGEGRMGEKIIQVLKVWWFQRGQTSMIDRSGTDVFPIRIQEIDNILFINCKTINGNLFNKLNQQFQSTPPLPPQLLPHC